MVQVGLSKRPAWTRCFASPVEVHHMLLRSRGGTVLDAYGETMHLIALCRTHHRTAHGPHGYEMGLIIDGYVSSGADGRPVYQGRHEGLRAEYGAVDLPELPEEVPGPGPSSGL